MKKGLALIAMLLAVLMLTGCNLIGYDEALDGAQIVAKVNDAEITKSEWLAYRNYLASYYEEYYATYLGISMPLTEESIKSYNEPALEDMIESLVLSQKMEELGFSPLSESDTAEVEEYADSMIDFYKMLLRAQNYPEIETVEEEYDRLLAEATAAAEAAAEPVDEDATPSEAVEAIVVEVDPSLQVATVTDEELDAMLTADLAEMGYTREYLIDNQTISLQNDLLRASVTDSVTVSDEEVRAEFDSRAEAQQTSYDLTPTLYATAVNNGSDVYYVPAGYRGVKNLLVSISSEDQSAISELSSTLTTSQNTLNNIQSQLDELAQEDTSDYDDEAKAAFDEQVAALTTQLEQLQVSVADTQAELDERTTSAFDAVLPKAEEALAKALAGEDFGALIAEYGDDPGMLSEPAATQGYLICDGLTLYVTEFQDAAMALQNVGDVTDELVKTSYGYHILKYETDIEPGVVEFTDEIAEHIASELLATAQDAAYEAAVTQWVSEANVKTYPKVME